MTRTKSSAPLGVPLGMMVDSYATVRNRRLLFDLPPGIGDYELSLTLQEKNGDVALDEVTVLVKARP